MRSKGSTKGENMAITIHTPVQIANRNINDMV